MKSHSTLHWQKGFSVVVLLIIIAIFLLIAAGGFFWIRSQTSYQTMESQLKQQTDSYAQPTVPVTDFAPGVPDSQKIEITIRKSDSSLQKFHITKSLVAGFIKHLPPGDHVVSQTPLEQ